MRNRKNVIVLLLTLLFTLLSMTFVGCKKLSEQENQKTLSLTATELTIEVGEEKTLTVVGNTSGGVVWSVDDEDIIRVSNGTITALTAGVTSVSATADGLTATCTITVTEKTKVKAELKIDVKSTVLYTEMEMPVTAYLTANGKLLEDNVDVAWTTEGEALRFEEGKVIGAQVGEGVLKATYSYNGETLSAARVINVQDLYIFSLTQNQYNLAIEDGYKTAKIQAQVYRLTSEGKQPYEDANLTYTIADESVASVSENGEITAKKSGETTVEISYDDTVKRVQVSVYDEAIETAEDFQKMRNNPSGKYMLVKDIDLAYNPELANGDDVSTYWERFEFAGILNGNGYAVRNLVIGFKQDLGGKQRWNAGLFSTLLEGGVVENISFEDVTMQSDYFVHSAGGICGFNYGTIRNVFIAIDFQTNFASMSCGGLVGGNQGVIENCIVISKVQSADMYGAVAGNSYNNLIRNCYAVTNADVSIARENQTIENCKVYTSTNELIMKEAFEKFDAWTVTATGLPVLKQYIFFVEK